MTTSELESVSLGIADRDSIHNLFTEGYGDAYKPHVVDFYLDRATKMPGIINGLGDLAAAALLENGRIACAATTTNRQPGGRIALGLQIMELCRSEGATWMSVGKQHRIVQIGAKAVGMERVADQNVIATLLDENGVKDNYHLVRDPTDGLLVTRNPNRKPAPYYQQIWAWPEAHNV